MSYFTTPGGPTSAMVVTAGRPVAQSGFWDTFTGALKTGAKTALDIQIEAARQADATQAQIAAMQAQAAQQSRTPAWLWPVVIGGGVLAVVFLLKSGKRQNPGRRRNRVSCPAGRKGRLTAARRHHLPSSRFADPAYEGLPLDSKGRIRAAMSRFGQYRRGQASRAERKRWFGRILRAARACGMDTSGFESRWRSRLR